MEIEIQKVTQEDNGDTSCSVTNTEQSLENITEVMMWMECQTDSYYYI
jgi:hypothetical protein